jgi:hypothetical protein
MCLTVQDLARQGLETMQQIGRALALGDAPGGVSTAEQMAADMNRTYQVRGHQRRLHWVCPLT